jgi:hypothetical protein
MFLDKIPCKICGIQVLFKNFEEHSSFCRAKEELEQKLHNNNTQIEKTLIQLEKSFQDLSLKYKLKKFLHIKFLKTLVTLKFV